MYVTQIPQAPLRILVKASLQQQTDAGWCLLRQGVPLRLAPKDSHDGVRHRAALERGAAGEHFVQDASECPDVGAFVDDVTPRLLGTDVSRRTRTAPALVWFAAIVGDCVRSGVEAAPAVFARPKSRTFATPSGVILMLAGFRSRWMIPFS
jgi:hypothetical protein